MRRVWMMLVVVALAGCSPAQTAAPNPTALPAEPAAAPTTAPAPTAQPTAAPTAAPSEPTAAPTVAPAAEATAAPLAKESFPDSEALLTQPFDVAVQARALLPEVQSDLDRAGEWNRYTIVATLDTQARTFSGRQRVEYTNRDTVALDDLYFRLYPNLRDFGGRLTVSGVTVDGQAARASNPRADLLRVRLPAALAPGETATVLLSFTTRAPANASRSSYGAFNKENGMFGLPSAYPLAAVVRGGQWDIAPLDGRGDFVNAETALYDVTLTGPSDWRLVTTGVAVEYQAEGASQRARFVSGPQREFTITALQLEQASAEVDGTRINSFFRSGSATGGQTALQVASDALRAFNKRYGRYPLAELDVIEMDARSFLGVEYPGLIMIEHALYTQPGILSTTVAHEVGHQWWYSIVGNDVQRTSWLDEALASYSQIIYQEEVNGPEAAERELQGFRDRYIQNRRAGRDAPVEQPNASFRSNYVALVYGKSVLFFQALRVQLGEQGFDRFLHEYYARHRYGYVSGADVVATANDICGCDVGPLYADWITRTVPLEVP
ncbi:MAG TPA: M1 family metallopeptidase [Roseiflexaceae bacterium]|nr:M1 family metallopeptidase [Roseiflexaceae bacterium]